MIIVDFKKQHIILLHYASVSWVLILLSPLFLVEASLFQSSL